MSFFLVKDSLHFCHLFKIKKLYIYFLKSLQSKKFNQINQQFEKPELTQ